MWGASPRSLCEGPVRDRGHRTFLRSCRLHYKLMTGRFLLIGFVRMLAKTYRPQDQMKMVRKNTETQQIDSEVCRQTLKLLFDPDFSMVVVLAGNRVISKKEAAAHYPSLKFQFLGQSLHFSRKLSNLFLKLLAAGTIRSWRFRFHRHNITHSPIPLKYQFHPINTYK